ncbi:HAD hydrolase, family IB [Legionella busanensis]|uniref:HAD hydrolase, family IB n=1 Tax=Legionella busanensis TaxID=190655 RepID=A0A378JLB1_9GAMM|nr:HAD-IB family hydrolase [Legionella busanensis]STX51009.1 HAD hydrolase, family IB [Legionella busanensis]
MTVGTEKVAAVAIFDFDGTITYKSTTLPFLKFIYKKSFFLKLMAKLPTILAYYSKRINIDQLNQAISTTFFQNLSRDFLYEAGQEFATQIIPTLVKKSAMECIKRHKDQGHYCILATSAYNIYIDYWAKNNGFDDLVSTKIAFNEKGLATGYLDGKSCYGTEKLQQVLNLIGTNTQVIYAYGDSSGDIPLLNYATFAHYQLFK